MKQSLASLPAFDGGGQMTYSSSSPFRTPQCKTEVKKAVPDILFHQIRRVVQADIQNRRPLNRQEGRRHFPESLDISRDAGVGATLQHPNHGGKDPAVAAGQLASGPLVLLLRVKILVAPPEMIFGM
jgi:hypothetical protein